MSSPVNTPSAVADPGDRRIVNANYDTTNVLSIDDAAERLLTTLDSCIAILEKHCGPRTGYTMLVDEVSSSSNQFSLNQFTRDGIRIMKFVEFMSPLERYVKDILTYTGEMVDKAAHDGTTTSMLFAAHMLKMLIAHRELLSTNRSTMFLNQRTTREVFQRFLKEIEDRTITLEDFCAEIYKETTEETLRWAAGDVAMMQALSSSGGDMELALAMKKIFNNSPKETWDVIDWRYSHKETDERFVVETDPFDLRLRAVTALEGILTEGFGTEYKCDDALCVVLPEAMIPGDFATETMLEVIFKASDEQRKEIIIVCPHTDGKILQRIVDHNKQQGAFPIILWQFSPEERINGQTFPWELMVANAKTGVTPYRVLQAMGIMEPTLEQFAFTAKVHYQDGWLMFYNAVPNTDENSVLNPMFAHPETATQFFTETAEELQRQIKEHQEGFRPDSALEGHLKRMYNALITLHRPRLRIGGPAHEQIALRDVVEDVQGAIMSSLQHGFLASGIDTVHSAAFATEVNTIKELLHQNSCSSTLQRFLAFCLCQTAHEIRSTAHLIVTCDGSDTEFVDRVDKPLYIYTISGSARETIPPKYYYDNALVDPHWGTKRLGLDDYEPCHDIRHFLNSEYIESELDYPPVQPVVIIREITKRLQELTMKVAFTDQIVIGGGVIAKEEPDPQEVNYAGH